MQLDLESLAEATSGAIGSLVSTTVLYPLDTCKSKYQAEIQTRKYRNLVDVLWEAIFTRQVLSLYQGLGTKNLQSVISQFIYFYGYSYFKRLYLRKTGNKEIATSANLIIAAGAAACTTIVTQPLDTASSRMQTSEFGKHEGLWKTIKRGSFSNAFDGLRVSLLLTSNPAIQYTVFDKLKQRIQRRNKDKDSALATLSVSSAFVLGAVSKTVATILTYPAIRCKVMIQSPNEINDNDETPAKESKTMWEVVRAIWKREGLPGFFKGLQAQILKTILSTALLMAIKEKVSAATWLFLLTSTRFLRQEGT